MVSYLHAAFSYPARVVSIVHVYPNHLFVSSTSIESWSLPSYIGAETLKWRQAAVSHYQSLSKATMQDNDSRDSNSVPLLTSGMIRRSFPMLLHGRAWAIFDALSEDQMDSYHHLKKEILDRQVEPRH